MIVDTTQEQPIQEEQHTVTDGTDLLQIRTLKMLGRI